MAHLIDSRELDARARQPKRSGVDCRWLNEVCIADAALVDQAWGNEIVAKSSQETPGSALRLAGLPPAGAERIAREGGLSSIDFFANARYVVEHLEAAS